MPSHKKMRERYFKARGLKKPPESSEERFNLAYEFIKAVPPDYEAAFMLYDAEVDAAHPIWLAKLGYILDEERSPLFNSNRANLFFRAASAGGNEVASYNLGLKYYSGYEQEVDIERAEYWFNLAKEQGDQNAPFMLATIRSDFDWRFDHPDHADFTNETIEMYREALKASDLRALAYLAFARINGRILEQDISAAIKGYSLLIEREPSFLEVTVHARTALILAIRTFYGLDVEQDKAQVNYCLDLIPKKSNHDYINNFIHPTKELLLSVIPESDVYVDFIRLIKEQGSLAQVMEVLSKQERDFTVGLVKHLHLINFLCQSEDWKDKRDWADLYEAALAKVVGTSFETATHASLVSGPRYTPLDENGFPVLGIWESPSESQEELETHQVTTGSYVPMPGVIAINGITAHPTKGILFDVETSDTLPAMLLQEDFDVAMALAFGDKNRVLWPSLSLEATDHKDLSDTSKNLLQNKVFYPTWLGHTDFGRTLYITDEIIGAFAWNYKDLQVGEPDQVFKDGINEAGEGLLWSLKLTGGRQGEGQSSRVMICPEHTDFNVFYKREGLKKSLVITPNRFTMRVDGSYILKQEAGKENRLVALNDTTFEQGRICQKLTDHFGLIASLDPRFERLTQIMRLFHMLAAIREESDYTLPPEHLARCQEHLKKFEAKGELPLQDRICRRMPLMK